MKKQAGHAVIPQYGQLEQEDHNFVPNLDNKQFTKFVSQNKKRRVNKKAQCKGFGFNYLL